MDKINAERKSIRLKSFDYSSCGAYFITICTADRRNHFWNNVGATIGRPQDIQLTPYGKIVDDAINQIPKIYDSVFVDSYVIMPNHIHLILVIHADEHGRPMVAPTISRIVAQMKGCVSKRIGKSIWQKLFFDHIIRNKQDYEEHRKYIYENPLRWYYDELYTKE